MYDTDNKKVIIPTYCKSIKTNRTLASFSVLGDNGSFYNVPTYYKKVEVPIHSRIVCGSDGIFDVIHDRDEIFTKESLTSDELANEAYSRWTKRSFNVKTNLNPNKILGKSKLPGSDDISVCIINL